MPYTDGAMWEAARDRAPSLDTAVLGGSGGANLVVNGTAAFIRLGRVSEGYARVLGAFPARGRWFTPEEDRAGGPAVAVLSHGAWQSYFGGDPGIVGRAILLRGEPHEVVGVMPAGFVGTAEADAWTPLRPSATGEGAGTNYFVIARLAPGASWGQAEGELRAVTPEAFRIFGLPEGTTRELRVQPMQDVLRADVRQPLVLLTAAVSAVLLIACVNLAALMLARGATRAKEIATRMALGGGRRAVVRQLMVEAVVVALVGGLAGVLVAHFGLDALKALGGARFEDWNRAVIDARVLAIAFGLAALTSVLFGLAPAIQASRLDVSRALVGGGSRGVAGPTSAWPRRALVIAEVALGVVLLVATGLLVRTFVNVRSLDPGFDPDGLVSVSVSLQDARYRDAASVNHLFDESLRRLTATPGVESAAVSLRLPYERLLNSGFRFVEEPPESGRTTTVSYVTPEFLGTLKLPLVRGRDLRATDRSGAPPIVLVNETFERVYSKEKPAIGRRIRLGGVEREIVGITGDIQARPSFGGAGISSGPLVSLPLVLVPAAQTTDGYFRSAHTWFSPAWTVRARDRAAASSAIARAIQAVDPQLPVSSVRAMDQVMAESITEQRLLMTLVAALAGAALLLAAIGVHGIIAHSVAERRREFGIRIALGATAGSAVRMVSMSGILLTVTGAVVGLLLSIPATSLVRAFLWRVEANDPWTYAGVALLLLVVAIVSSLLPALKLLRLNPAESLRN
jgi:predicted permease